MHLCKLLKCHFIFSLYFLFLVCCIKLFQFDGVVVVFFFSFFHLLAHHYLILSYLNFHFHFHFINDTIQSHEIHGLETYTQYLVSLQVFNPEGPGPATTVLVMTDEGGKRAFLYIYIGLVIYTFCFQNLNSTIFESVLQILLETIIFGKHRI